MANKKLQPPRSVGRALNFATSACNALCNDILGEHGLSLPQWVIMSALWRQDGLLMTELADYTSNNQPATSRIVDRMIERDLLKRDAVAGDRRAVRISLTERGRSLDHLADFYQLINDRLLEGLSKTEADTLFELLKRVDSNARSKI